MVVNQEYDQIIIGAGIVGISLGLAILEQNSGAKVLIIDNITYLKTETENAKNALPLMKQLKDLKITKRI